MGSQTANTNAILHLVSTTKGFLPTRHTTSERTTLGVNLAANQGGMISYDSQENLLYVLNGTAWVNTFSDDQGFDIFQLNGTSLEASLDDNVLTNSVDLSPLLTDLETRVTALENATGAGSGTVPELLNYQTVIRDDANELVAGEDVSFRMTVLQTSSTGIPVYVETHIVTTSDLGLANFTIGSGVTSLGDF
ncbi:MAG: hypothetical protein HRT68_11425 [Flavobacteriaceae bacterium]|nr:hypothetical protein [Flavobacteriaceae bacterium]